jgi:CheY-like chemotaxis protein
MIEKNSGHKTILIVEDEPILGRVCARILEMNGYATTLVTNGLTAKNMVEKNHYDFCLSDIKTPVMNGMELYKYLKEEIPALAAKTVFMTGDVLSKDVEIFLRESNAPYILKPFTDADLTKIVSEHINK